MCLCVWEIDTRNFIGSECEWSSDDSVQFISSMHITKLVAGHGFNNTIWNHATSHPVNYKERVHYNANLLPLQAYQYLQVHLKCRQPTMTVHVHTQYHRNSRTSATVQRLGPIFEEGQLGRDCHIAPTQAIFSAGRYIATVAITWQKPIFVRVQGSSKSVSLSNRNFIFHSPLVSE